MLKICKDKDYATQGGDNKTKRRVNSKLHVLLLDTVRFKVTIECRGNALLICKDPFNVKTEKIRSCSGLNGDKAEMIKNEKLSNLFFLTISVLLR